MCGDLAGRPSSPEGLASSPQERPPRAGTPGVFLVCVEAGPHTRSMGIRFRGGMLRTETFSGDCPLASGGCRPKINRMVGIGPTAPSEARHLRVVHTGNGIGEATQNGGPTAARTLRTPRSGLERNLLEQSNELEHPHHTGRSRDDRERRAVRFRTLLRHHHSAETGRIDEVVPRRSILTPETPSLHELLSSSSMSGKICRS
jgi:hypothetical protein